MQTLKLAPISNEGLAPLAFLMQAGGTRRTEFPAVVEPGPGEGHASIAVLRTEPAAPDAFVVDRMERHPHSAQTFIPLAVARYFVVVAPEAADGGPDMTQARGFVAGPGQAIVYPRNVWHASMMVADTPADLVVMLWRSAAGGDTLFHALAEPVRLVP
jgi:ureidoglycolate lyase